MVSESFYPIAKKDSLVRWYDELKHALGMESSPSESYRLSICDSFDWRLYSAGLIMDWMVTPQAMRLRLIGLDSRKVQVEQNLEPKKLRFTSDLPDGALKQQIAPLLDIRALLPVATLAVRSYCLHRKNQEGKTLARVFIESFSVISSSGNIHLIAKRLRLQPLRGYEKASRVIAHTLKKRYKLTAGEDDLYEKALEAVGASAGAYSGKLNVPLDPQLRSDAAVRAVLTELFATIQVNEAGTLEDIDTEFLHDYRVAVRRTRSALGELKGVFPPSTLKRFRREFAWLGGVTSPLRDLDVYLLKFDNLKSGLPAGLRDGLEPLRTFLQYKQREQQAGFLVPELQGQRYRKLKSQWQRYLETPLARRPAARDAAKPIDAYAGQRVWRMYKRVMREGMAINDDSPPPELHELRKSCKKLRYLMEFFQSLYPRKKIRSLIRELKQLQENLGDFQDLDVQISAMQGFSMEMRRRGEYNAATAESMQALLKILSAQMLTVRAEFHARFERFAQEANRDCFKALFKAEASRVSA